MNEEPLPPSPPKPSFLTRKNFYLLSLICFLVPHLIILAHSLSSVSQEQGKRIFLSAFFVVGGGLFLSLLLLRKFEKKMQEKVSFLVRAKVESMGGIDTLKLEEKLLEKSHGETPRLKEERDFLQTSLAQEKERGDLLEIELEKFLGEMRLKERDYGDLRREQERTLEEIHQLKEEHSNELKHKDALLYEYQQTIQEQRGVIEKKQRHLNKLEGKVRDQMYEIRSLLQLDDPKPAKHFPFSDASDKKEDLTHYYLPSALPEKREVVTAYDLSLILQKYVELAEKFTGLGTKEGSTPRFLDLSLESYAIDLRYLFDSLREEPSGILFVYSRKEGKILFVNSQAKTLLGWSPEKLKQDFAQLVVSGYAHFHENLTYLSGAKEASVALVIRSKNGDEIPLQCLMEEVKSGPFLNHVVGLLAPLNALF